VRAIVRAAARVSADGVAPDPEIMLPLIADGGEIRLLRERIEKVIEDLQKKLGGPAEYKIGTMIELPRAALTADEIAEFADFFSFGTNDLTQTTYGFSRDDAEGKFLLRYVEEGIIAEDPFQVLDREGVGRLVEIGVGLGKGRKPELQVGVCGEHGGDPSSIEFFHDVGLDYVSCSPYRVPVARLAAAQAAIRSAARS
jgi:pyruvate,orthophosphate dikinase